MNCLHYTSVISATLFRSTGPGIARAAILVLRSSIIIASGLVIFNYSGSCVGELNHRKFWCMLLAMMIEFGWTACYVRQNLLGMVWSRLQPRWVWGRKQNPRHNLLQRVWCFLHVCSHYNSGHIHGGTLYFMRVDFFAFILIYWFRMSPLGNSWVLTR